MSMKLDVAQKIVTEGLRAARAKNMRPLAIVVLDERGSMRAVAAEDNTSVGRTKIAFGKANGVIQMGLGSRALAERAKTMTQFMVAADNAFGGLIAVPGGVLIKDASGAVVGAVGVSGDTSDNDEIAALAGLAAVGLIGDTGA